MIRPTESGGRQALLITTLALAMTVAVLLQVAFGALGPFLTRDLGLSRTQLGSLTTAMYVSAAALSMSAGRWSDRLGARMPLMALFGSMAASVLVVAVSPDYPWLILGSLSCGFAIAIANPVTNMVIQRQVRPASQGIVTGVKQAGIQVGVFVGSAALPVVATVSNWRIAVATCIAVCLLGLVLTRQTVAPQSTAPDGPSPRTKTDRLPPGTGWLTVYALAMGMGISSVSAYLPLFAVEDLHLTETVAGWTSAVVGAIAILARLGWGQLADRVASTVRWALVVMCAVAVVGALGLAVTTSDRQLLLWGSAILIGSSLAAWNGVAMLAVIRQAPRSVAGVASGVVLIGFYGGFALGPVLFGWIVDRQGIYAQGWTMVALVTAAATLLAVIWRRRAFSASAATPNAVIPPGSGTPPLRTHMRNTP